jgi:mannose-6-phosphate isomerase-like protein (cupin superfamily)
MSTKAARAASVTIYDKEKPQLSTPKARTWLTRGANFVVAFSRVEPGAILERENNADEYMLIIPPGSARVTITAGKETIEAEADSLTIIPPGPSKIMAKTGGMLARIISKHATDLTEKAVNADNYADGAPECADVINWPEPVGGFKLRHYPLAPYYKPDGDRIQPRLFRSTNMMVNLFAYYQTRRDTKTLSPHWHEDFEQASLCFAGQWIHHSRWPWTADLAEWKPDFSETLETPSVIIIPANVIHTSRDTGTGDSALYDIFCPPRMDFASKPGFVINEAEYPLPADMDRNVVTKGTLLNWQKPA